MLRQDYVATLLVMIALVASTLTGFAREVVLAHQLGAGRDADIYLVAFALPEFAFVTLYVVVPSTFIPLFADYRLHAGEREAWRFALRVTGTLLAVLLIIVASAVIGAPLYLRWLGPGLDQSETGLAVSAARLMLPSIALMGVATLAGAVLQACRRFVRPALVYVIYNLVFVVVLLGAPLAWSVRRAAWGVTLGAAGAAVVLLAALWRQRPGLDSSSEESALVTGSDGPLPGVAQVFRSAVPLAAAYGVHHLIWLVDRAMATALGLGSAAALNYARHVTQVVSQLSGWAVSIVLFPRLAEQVACGDHPGARISLAGALRFALMVGLPASCGLIILREPLVQALFQRGAFDRAATAVVSKPLVWYGAGALADALCQPLWRVVYAKRRAWVVLGVNGLQTAIRLAGNVVFSHHFGYNGLALSAALGLLIQVLVLAGLAWHYLGAYLRGTWWREAAYTALATIVAAFVMCLAATRLSAAPAVISLLAGGASGMLVYLIALRCSRYLRKGLVWSQRG
jgi:putative peptidoglycan lipid II flippase